MKLFSVIKKLYLAIALAFVPCSLTIFLYLYESGPWWELGMVLAPLLMLVYVFPFYLLYIELGAALGRRLDGGLRSDGRLRSNGERRLGYATTAVAGLLGVLAVILLLLSDDVLPPALAIVFLLVYSSLPVLWLIGAGVYKKRLPIKAWLSDKGILIPALILIVLALITGIVALALNLSGGFHPGGVPDPMG